LHARKETDAQRALPRKPFYEAPLVRPSGEPGALVRAEHANDFVLPPGVRATRFLGSRHSSNQAAVGICHPGILSFSCFPAGWQPGALAASMKRAGQAVGAFGCRAALSRGCHVWSAAALRHVREGAGRACLQSGCNRRCHGPGHGGVRLLSGASVAAHVLFRNCPGVSK
jgi:hypothetical protein